MTQKAHNLHGENTSCLISERGELYDAKWDLTEATKRFNLDVKLFIYGTLS